MQRYQPRPNNVLNNRVCLKVKRIEVEVEGNMYSLQVGKTNLRSTNLRSIGYT